MYNRKGPLLNHVGIELGAGMDQEESVFLINELMQKVKL